MTSSTPHVVCFPPYTDWSIHSARQVTILHGLRQRGASTTYVTCDGIFSDCDLFQKATSAEPSLTQSLKNLYREMWAHSC